MSNDGDKAETIHATIDVLKDATSIIPIGGIVFEECLDTVELGLKQVVEGVELDICRRAVHWSYVTDGELKDTRNSWNLSEERNWKDGPSLKDLAERNLTQEEIYGIAPYIEYRVNYEITEVFGMSLPELIAAYEKCK